MPKSLPIACGGWLFEVGALPFALELQAILFCVLRGGKKGMAQRVGQPGKINCAR